MEKNNYGIIMAGGIGSRFWPMSTEEKPKQFLDILGTGKSLIQMTYNRMLNFVPADQIYILTNTSYKDLVLSQLEGLKPSQVLTEPKRKNTAPCIAYAAAKLSQLNPDANLVVAPSDHLILQEDEFVKTIAQALESSSKGNICTLGIKPTRPDTGYGYIEFNAEFERVPNAIYPVEKFREKPDLATANEFLNAGNYYWNSGIFVWKAATILSSLQKYRPDLHTLFTERSNLYNTENEQDYVNTCFERCESISIDFAIMEHATNIEVILANFDWSDLGTWGSLYTHLDKDTVGNAVVGSNVIMPNSSNCMVNVPNSTTAIIEGLDDYIVIQAENKLMILRKEQEQELKKYIE